MSSRPANSQEQDVEALRERRNTIRQEIADLSKEIDGTSAKEDDDTVLEESAKAAHAKEAAISSSADCTVDTPANTTPMTIVDTAFAARVQSSTRTTSLLSASIAAAATVAALSTMATTSPTSPTETSPTETTNSPRVANHPSRLPTTRSAHIESGADTSPPFPSGRSMILSKSCDLGTSLDNDMASNKPIKIPSPTAPAFATISSQSHLSLLASSPKSASRSQMLLSPEEQRRLELLHMGKKRFNLAPKKGIQFLAENGFFSSKQPSAEDVASFLLHNGDMLNKRMVGEYLGENTPFHLQVLKHFIQLQSFSDVAFDVSLRRFLSTFRLPGEAQKIDRMMEGFAQRYIECNPGSPVFHGSTDTVYILAFSVIMLNTDLHNPAIKNKIKKETFIRNNRDVLKSNGGISQEDGGISQQFLESLYKSIQENPLRLNAGSGNSTSGGASGGGGEEEDPLNNPFYYTFVNPEREGWLIKQGGRIKTWKKRYCILTGSCLYYYANNDSITQQPCGILPLENLQVIPVSSSEVGGTSMTTLRKRYFFFKLIGASGEESEKKPLSGGSGSPLDTTEDVDNRPQVASLSKPMTVKTIKAAKTNSDGRIVEGRHSEYIFGCESEDERQDWMGSIQAQMARPPVYILWAERRKRTVEPSSAREGRPDSIITGGAVVAIDKDDMDAEELQ